MVRVTHIVHDFEGGGLESLVGAMAKGFDRSRVTTSVVSLSGRIGRLGRELEHEIESVTAIRPKRLVSLVLPYDIIGAVRRTRPQVIHAHSGVWYKAALASTLGRLGPLIFTEHGREHDDNRFSRVTSRVAAAMTDAVVAVSERLERYMHDRLGVPRDRLMTIENGVDTDHFSPGVPTTMTRKSLGIPAEALIVGSVGRLEPVKAYHRLMDSVARVAERRGSGADPIYVLLCGDGSQRGPLEALARSRGIADRVRFAGWVSDPVDAYRLMDVFMLPSVSEGLSVSLLESMATGAVPLVTPVGANSVVLGDALASQVVPAEDIGPFAEALYRTLESADRRRIQAEAGRSIVVGRFSQVRMLDDYTALYERLAAGRRARL